MSPRTIFLSKLLGLYCVVVGLAMLVHRHATLETMRTIVHDAPALYIAGIIALAIGLAMVLGHNVWKGGVLPIVVTVVGWISLIKGLLILFVPAHAVEGCFVGGHYHLYFYLKAAVTLILGAYLTYGGFTSKSS